VRQNWQMFETAISTETCNSMVESLCVIEPQDGKIFSTNQDSDFRKSKIRWVHNQPAIKQFLYEKICEANRNAFNFDVENYCQIQFTEYSSEYGGCYSWHHDVDWNDNKAFDRKLSIVVQLTDHKSYEGGNLEFDEVQGPQPLRLRKQGTIIVFPSYLRHRVTPVTSGIRHSLVAWFEGPRWR